MNYRCDKCGGNHNSFDCSKPHNGWREREPAQERSRPKPATLTPSGDENAPERVLDAANSVKKEWFDPATGRNKHGLSGPLPTRSDFPFLRESTRRAMDEQIAKTTTARRDAADLPEKPKDRPSVVLPRREQEGLFR